MNKYIVLFFLLFTGCVSTTQAPQKSNLTFGTVKKSIEKGRTSQSDIVQLLGSPNITTKNKNSQEVWIYSRQSYNSESGAFGGGLLFFGGNSAFSTQSSNSFDLIITFDVNDIVTDYSVVQSQF